MQFLSKRIDKSNWQHLNHKTLAKYNLQSNLQCTIRLSVQGTSKYIQCLELFKYFTSMSLSELNCYKHPIIKFDTTGKVKI